MKRRDLLNGFAAGAAGLLLPERYARATPAQQMLLAGGGGDPATDPNFANVVILLHGDGSNGGTTFTDSSSYARAFTTGNGVTTSTTQIKFGTASIKSDPSVSPFAPRLTTVTAAALTIGSGDFTVEFWMYGATNGCFFTQIPATAAGPPWYWRFYYNTGGYFQVIDNNDTGVADWTFTPSAATWHHLALVRISGVLTLYFDGVLKTKGGSVNENRTLSQGAWAFSQKTTGSPTTDSLYNLSGYIDDYRVTIGVGRYTSNFTPRSTAFPNS